MDFIIRLAINLLCGITVMIIHELPKALAAHFLTHPIHKKRQIILASPIKYIDPIGLVLFTVSFIGVGWQKPYTYNPAILRDKQRSLLPIMIVGELTSLFMVVLMLPVWKQLSLMDANQYLIFMVDKFVIFNFIIFLVNLFPLPPFDMSQIVYAYSPVTYSKLMQNKPYLLAAFLLLVLLGVIEMLGLGILEAWLGLFA